MARRPQVTLFDIFSIFALFQNPVVGCIVFGSFFLMLSILFSIFLPEYSTFTFVLTIILFTGALLSFVSGSDNDDYDDDDEDETSMSSYDNYTENRVTTGRRAENEHELVSAIYNVKLRSVRIIIREKKYYRTIERYVTRNYVKYPVYSDWKSKHKDITISVRLTNATLENLNNHQEPLVRKFAYEIIKKIGRAELYPSWFIEMSYREEYEAGVRRRNKDIQVSQYTYNTALENFGKAEKIRARMINDITRQLSPLYKKKASLTKRIQRAQRRNKSLFLNIVTFFIYAYICSDRYKSKLELKLKEVDNLITRLEEKIAKYNADSSNESCKLNEQLTALNDLREQARQLEQSELEQLNQRISEITPLVTDIDNSSDFVPLRDFLGMEYSKIVGCYIIRNNENGKFYVGQSKDIIKRIHQHFKGTEPHNIIFAEDYYSSQLSDKTMLFSIRVMPCEKAQLDTYERLLIEEYNAYVNGYNSTKGNT